MFVHSADTDADTPFHRYIEQWSTYREHIPFANGFTWNARTLGTIALWGGLFPYFLYSVCYIVFLLGTTIVVLCVSTTMSRLQTVMRSSCADPDTVRA
jgi:hypothetical protein